MISMLSADSLHHLDNIMIYGKSWIPDREAGDKNFTASYGTKWPRERLQEAVN
jgi:hypothetical protein